MQIFLRRFGNVVKIQHLFYANISPGNGLMSDGTKPSYELMLNNHERGILPGTIAQEILEISNLDINLKITN